MKAHERAQRGTRQFLLARSCVAASGYVATAILTRKLGPTNYGIYGVVMSQVLWLEMLANAGVPGAIAKLMADGRHDHGEVERSARALLVGLSVFPLAVCFLIAPQVAGLMRIPNGAVLFRIAILDLPFMAVFTSYDGIPRFGPMGAAISMLLGLAIGAAVTGAMAHRRFGTLIQSSTLVRVAAAATLVGLVSTVCPVRGPLVMAKLALLGGLYLLVLYLLGEIKVKDFRLLRRSPDSPTT